MLHSVSWGIQQEVVLHTEVLHTGSQAGGHPQVSWGGAGEAFPLVAPAALVVTDTIGQTRGLKGEAQGFKREGGLAGGV